MNAGRILRPGEAFRYGAALFIQLYRVWHELYQGKRTELPRFLNSLILIFARASSAGLGFLTWLLTARLYASGEVGIASGVVSAMMLGVQLALFGVGSAVISLYAQHQSRPAALLNTAFSLVSVTSSVTAGLFLLMASVLFRELSIVSASPGYALQFVAICTFGTINVLLDYVSIAMRRGDQVLARNVLFGVVTGVGVVLLPHQGSALTSKTIVFAWTLAGFGACALGALQLWRSPLRYCYRPRVDVHLGRELIRVSLPNYALTLTERAPNWVIPIVVTELLSPVENAHWYSVWMMAWVVFIVPISVGQTLFAEVARRPDTAEDSVRHSIRTALGLGCLMAFGVGVLAHFLLSLLGNEYAAAGATPLRILVVAVVPVTIIQTYYAVCRASRRLREATLTAVVSALVGILAAAVSGVSIGVTGIAVTWLVVQSITSLWSIWRLRLLRT